MTERIYLTVNVICNFSIIYYVASIALALGSVNGRGGPALHVFGGLFNGPSAAASPEGLQFPLQRPQFPNRPCICLVNHFHILNTLLEAAYQTDKNGNSVV